MATVRKDGAPRLRPECPTPCDGRLYSLEVASPIVTPQGV